MSAANGLRRLSAIVALSAPDSPSRSTVRGLGDLLRAAQGKAHQLDHTLRSPR